MRPILLIAITLCCIVTLRAQEVATVDTPSFTLQLPEGFIEGGESPWSKETLVGREYQRKFWVFKHPITREGFFVEQHHPQDNVFNLEAIKELVDHFKTVGSYEYTPSVWSDMEKSKKWKVTFTRRELMVENGMPKKVLRFYLIYV